MALTGSGVSPESGVPIFREAPESGATLVEVNPSKTSLVRRVDYALRGPAGVVLPGLLREAFGPPR